MPEKKLISVNFSKSQNKKLGVVVHTMVGSLDGTNSWFNNPSSGVSSHYGIDLDGSRVFQWVEENHIAYAQGIVSKPTFKLVTDRPGENPNNFLISIECADDGNPASADRSKQYPAIIELVKDICKRNNIPIDRDHIAAHREIRSTKTCPGNLDVDYIVREAAKQPESSQNDWNGVLSHFKVKDAKELVEMVEREFGFLASAREEIKQITDIFNQRREKLAQNLMTVNDWDEIIVASGRFKGLDEKNQDLQVKLEKEQQAHKQTVLDYQEKLEALTKEIFEMKKRHETQIDNLQAKVDKEIAELKKAKEQYESVSKVISWFKGIFKKG